MNTAAQLPHLIFDGRIAPARTQPSQAADSTSNAGPSNSDRGGFMLQAVGESNLRAVARFERSADSCCCKAQAANSYPQTTASDQQSTSNSPEASSPPSKGLWGSLARRHACKTNDAPIRRPSGSQAATPSTTEQADDDVAESESVPQLLAPFYHTNSSPQTGHNNSPVASARSTHHGPDLEQAVRGSKLTQQLAMTTGDEPKCQDGRRCRCGAT